MGPGSRHSPDSIITRGAFAANRIGNDREIRWRFHFPVPVDDNPRPLGHRLNYRLSETRCGLPASCQSKRDELQTHELLPRSCPEQMKAKAAMASRQRSYLHAPPSAHSVQPGPRTKRPGFAPVYLPPFSTCTPLTNTSRTPVDSCCGFSKVAWSWIVAG